MIWGLCVLVVLGCLVAGFCGLGFGFACGLVVGWLIVRCFGWLFLG